MAVCLCLRSSFCVLSLRLRTKQVTFLTMKHRLENRPAMLFAHVLCTGIKNRAHVNHTHTWVLVKHVTVVLCWCILQEQEQKIHDICQGLSSSDPTWTFLDRVALTTLSPLILMLLWLWMAAMALASVIKLWSDICYGQWCFPYQVKRRMWASHQGKQALVLVEPLEPQRKPVFGRLQTFAQLGRAPARPESKFVLQKSKPEHCL